MPRWVNSTKSCGFEEYYNKNFEQFLADWKAFLRFKSVSALPEHDDDCTRCAKWLADHIKSIGFDVVKLLPTSGKPVIYAHFKGNPKKPSILYYGHYDVYQTNPLAPWKFGAFKPTLRNGRMYARGAQDNKGQTFFFLKALEALIKTKRLSSPVTLIIEGEEETTTSTGIIKLIPKIKSKIKSDILLVCDTECRSVNTPSIVLGLRGIVNVSFRLEGLKNDLHSGAHGGIVKNPAQEMAKLLATLHKEDGSIAVSGFYAGVRPLTEKEDEIVSNLSFDKKKYLREIGVPPIGGEIYYKTLVRRGFRPTLEVNGVYAGYIGPGVKTIIPSYSNAKLTARLVAGQDPKKCIQAITKHLEKYAPAGLKLKIEETGSGGPGIRIDPDAPLIKYGKRVIKKLFGNEPVFSWEGSSVPVVSTLLPKYCKSALLVGFGLEEDCVHAADESFSLDQFKAGYLYASNIIAEIGKLNK